MISQGKLIPINNIYDLRLFISTHAPYNSDFPVKTQAAYQRSVHAELLRFWRRNTKDGCGVAGEGGQQELIMRLGGGGVN